MLEDGAMVTQSFSCGSTVYEKKLVPRLPYTACGAAGRASPGVSPQV